ncbi:MAG: bile acid:sodium symporter family protein [bacterium]|nr:bile acid:sodium symporter family protein [bacterium]
MYRTQTGYLQDISTWVASHITIIVVLVAASALFYPPSFHWISTKAVTPMLGIVMFGMGLTLKASDFKPVLLHPKEIILGEIAQFVLMPGIAWLLCHLMGLPSDLALGVILVGCCPGGTASNVICYLAKGDIPLSVAMTGVSTMLAPVITPSLVFLLAGEAVNIDISGMFLSIIQVIIIPIASGVCVSHYLQNIRTSVEPYLPMVSTLSIAAIIGIIVSHNSTGIIQCSLTVAVVVVLHNTLGLLAGYSAALLCRIERPKRTAIAIEVGMQNSGLATSLAAMHFAMFPMATVPGALFSVWHNVSGSIAAQIFRRIGR